jgi:hypothetical protein
LLGEYLENDGRLLVMGELGTNLTQADREAILNHPGTRQVEVGAQFDLTWLPFGQQVQISIPADIAVNLQRVDGGLALHILRYDYNSQQDQVQILDELALDLHLPGNFSSAEVFAPGVLPSATLEASDGLHRLVLKNVPLYSIVLLKE